jgi:hypothetical protein
MPTAGDVRGNAFQAAQLSFLASFQDTHATRSLKLQGPFGVTLFALSVICQESALLPRMRHGGVFFAGCAVNLRLITRGPGADADRVPGVDGDVIYAGTGSPSGGDRAGLVIGYARPPEHACTTALARLAAVLAQPASHQLLPIPYPLACVEPGRSAVRSQGCVVGARGRHLRSPGPSIVAFDGWAVSGVPA